MPGNTVKSNRRATPGFYGKLPIRGDFVARSLSRAFVERWDAWLRDSLDRSRRQLGERWLDCYLTSPLWRFGLSREVCGEAPFAGVLMPSVDRVGRYFPLTIGVALPNDCSPLDLAIHANGWYRRVGEIALQGLEDALDLEAFAARIEALGVPEADASMPVEAASTDAGLAWHCSVKDPDRLGDACFNLARHLLEKHFSRYSFWWSSGSERITPCLLVCQGLPEPEGFAALLAGDWSRWGWSERPLAVPESAVSPPL